MGLLSTISFSNIIFPDARQSEVDLGYWGIRYMESSRNADYIYPLVGSILCFKLVKNDILKKVFILFFLITAVYSKSRGRFNNIHSSCFFFIFFI